MVALDWASSTSSATFTIGSSTYDVFLNFRGEDTRNNFTGFLNLVLKDRGIDVFIDSKKLWTGEAIGPALRRAIEGSKILIPVFSKGYAHSKWCLLELVQMVQCHISNGQMILPIFFDVEPSHVQNQTGSFEEAFRKHEKNFEPHIVESWREALRVVGNIKGEVIDKNKDQAEIVESVSKRVLDELVSSTYLAECKYPIGIDSRVKDPLSLLNIGSNDVQFMGICGSGGIGKTTIAKAVYNRIFLTFSRHSFISDVREQAMQCMGLVSLQKRLLKDIFKIDFDIGHYHRGKKLIERRLCKENVLLVLDDVDSKEQIDALAGELNWFGPGSRIIITTRAEHILNVAKVDKNKIYWPQELDRKESLQLFSLHAFSLDQPPQDYMQLSRDAIRYSGGLASTLEALGSYLSDISRKEVWENTLQNLNAGITSIYSLSSIHTQIENRCSMKDNSFAWRPLHGNTMQRESIVHTEREHMFYGNNTTFAREPKSTGEYLNPNGSTATIRVGKRFTIKSKIGAALSKITGGYLNLNGSTATVRAGKRFSMAEIRAATKNFDAKIGQGGFGSVYKGLINGTSVAIKRRSLESRQGLAEFKAEIEVLSKLRHRHVVSTIGFCEENKEKILVYEYMANGSLMDHLYGTNHPPLTWKQRLEISIGAARGLLYLHAGTEFGIIHRDVKASNILLDENFVAKMADFGLSKMVPSLDHSCVETCVAGTIGYLAPEYALRGKVSRKSDVYSFGVVLYEVVGARSPSGRRFTEDQIDSADWTPWWRRKRPLETIVDGRLKGNYCPESLKIFQDIADKCLAVEAKNRPTMGDVLWDLEYVLQVHEAWLRSNAGKESSNLVVENVQVVGTEEFQNPVGQEDESCIELRTEDNEEPWMWTTNEYSWF